MKRWLILLVIAVVLTAGLGGLWFHNLQAKIAAFKAAGTPKVAVTTIKAAPSEWRTMLHAVGSVRATRGVDLAPEVPGLVTAIHFESGQEVKAGTPLVQLYVADQEAQLKSLQANAELARIQLKRDTQQLGVNAISQSQLDTTTANLKSTQAQVAQQQALIAKTTVRAPFGGTLGIRQIDLGQYLSAGTKIATLQALDPIFIDFSLPQQNIVQIQPGQPISLTTDAVADESFSGKIAAIDPKIDPDTRNVQIRAQLANPHHRLLPGMYANIDIAIGEPQQLLTLPQTAITFNPYGETAYVVTTAGEFAKSQAEQNGQPAPAGAAATDPTPVVRQVFVTTGATRGDQIAVLKGLSADDEVVTGGQLKLRPGAPIVVDNSVQPANDAAPKPDNE
jgi:membrane fusion protein (multidrug efflux system)